MESAQNVTLTANAAIAKGPCRHPAADKQERQKQLGGDFTMSAKRQARKRHEFTVEGLLRAYSYPLCANRAEKPVPKSKPALRKKSKEPDASSTERTKRVAGKGQRGDSKEEFR